MHLIIIIRGGAIFDKAATHGWRLVKVKLKLENGKTLSRGAITETKINRLLITEIRLVSTITCCPCRRCFPAWSAHNRQEKRRASRIVVIEKRSPGIALQWTTAL
jgi:hypothetical protein